MHHVTGLDAIAAAAAIGGENEQELRQPDGGAGGALLGRADGVNPRKRSRSGDDDSEDKQSNVTEASSLANAPRRVATNASRAKETELLYWFDVTPPPPETMDGPQLESAAKITLDDIAGCIMLPIMDLHEEDASFPESDYQFILNFEFCHVKSEIQVCGALGAKYKTLNS